MERFHIDTVFAFDEDFRQYGQFMVVPLSHRQTGYYHYINLSCIIFIEE
jgi:hypothetical protein